MEASNIRKINVGILSFVLFFIIGGIAIVLLSIAGIIPFLNGFYPILFAALFLGLIGGSLGYFFSKTMSFIICVITLGSIDIDIEC